MAATATYNSNNTMMPHQQQSQPQPQQQEPWEGGAAGHAVRQTPKSSTMSTTTPSEAEYDSDRLSQTQQQCTSSTYSSSPRQNATDLPESILEEGAESGSESPAEPVTPTDPSASQTFGSYTVRSHDYDNDQNHSAHLNLNLNSPQPSADPNKAPLITSQAPTPSPGSTRPPSTVVADTGSPITAVETAVSDTPTLPKNPDPDAPPPLSRRSTRGSTSSFKRTMSSLFRRSTSQVAVAPPAPLDTSTAPSPNPRDNGPMRRFSMNRSYNSTRSNTPPSPTSPLEIANQTRSVPNATPANGHANASANGSTNGTSMPGEDDFKNKSRASTGLTLRGRAVNFVGRGTRTKTNRRASSFDAGKQSAYAHPNRPEEHGEHTYPVERAPWALPPDAGTGTKARRMSLSLPDDFTVDVAELQTEFEYHSKFLGRHGKHLGKGAASKVTLMSRKGCPNELYAVKEFRGKSKSETKDDYDKKIKSEFSLAKSLHHPNVVETIRLCTDHSRWNHVMEYCAEGDLFGLVQKGYLKGESRAKDRLCLFKQLIQGVHYLHCHGIAHRDIKLENLLITSDSKLKITDFGVSEVFSGTHPGLRESGGQCGQNMMGEVRLCSPGICGSEPYIAPEVLAKKTTYDPRALDVWSSAIIMVNLIFGGGLWVKAVPGEEWFDKLVVGWEKWYSKHPDEENPCVGESDYPHWLAFDQCVNPPALRRVLLQMLNPDPSKRITIQEAVNNRWVRKIECCQPESYEESGLAIDATKKTSTTGTNSKLFYHNHLPPKLPSGHHLMPGGH